MEILLRIRVVQQRMLKLLVAETDVDVRNKTDKGRRFPKLALTISVDADHTAPVRYHSFITASPICMHTLLLAFQVHVAPLVISHSKIHIAKLFRGLHTCILPLHPRPCSGAFPESITCPISAIE